MRILQDLIDWCYNWLSQVPEVYSEEAIDRVIRIIGLIVGSVLGILYWKVG